LPGKSIHAAFIAGIVRSAAGCMDNRFVYRKYFLDLSKF